MGGDSVKIESFVGEVLVAGGSFVLGIVLFGVSTFGFGAARGGLGTAVAFEIGRASCRERV